MEKPFKCYFLSCIFFNDNTKSSIQSIRYLSKLIYLNSNFHYLTTAVPILIIGNDEESKRLTGHTQYNSNIRFVFSNELVQDHASAGRVFSFWREMSPHQMSHLRKMIKPIFNEVKTVPQLRYITLTKWCCLWRMST